MAEQMTYRNLLDLEIPVSRLVYGTPGAAGGDDIGAAMDAYDLAWEKGFRIFDTAYSYGRGKCEESLGRWIAARGHRDEMVILDKGCDPGEHGSTDVFSGDTIRNQVRISQERLQTDHVELYILHRDDPTKPVDEIVEVLNEMKALGRIRHFGGSNWTMQRVKEANDYAAAHGLTGFTALSPNYCMARLVFDPWGGSVTISGDENADYRAWLAEKRMPVLSYSALGRGFLSGKYVTDGPAIEECLNRGPIMEYYYPENVARLKRAEEMAKEKGVPVSEIAIAWLLASPMDVLPIMTPSKEKHIDAALHALKMILTPEERRYLYYGDTAPRKAEP
ncbi:MAG: aldo/keto reductase [Lachnospiraceae bacterium]|nr:aldo/keto reductase [Lachnospiraceae bacterium]